MSASRKKLLLDGGNDDIICGLPNHVIDKIFERLPLKDAARTSILSRKWRYLSSRFPYIVFDKHFFEETIANKPNLPNSGSKYVNLINKVLLVHDGPVHNFELYIPNLIYDWDEHIDEWLLFLSRNGIQKLSLDYRCSTPYKLPSYIFSAPKLTNLKLRNVTVKPPVSFSGFANPLDLNFGRVKFVASPINAMYPVVPLLKTLTFIGCAGINYFNISSSHASCVAVSDVTPIFSNNFPNSSVIIILIGDLLRAVYEEKGISPINLRELHEKFPRSIGLRFDGCFLKLSAIAVTERRLSFVFNHLRHLQINFISFDDLDQISCTLSLLCSSPNLEIFQVTISPLKSSDVELVSTDLESPECLNTMLKLRRVELYSVKGSKSELVFIKCILANSPNLESLLVEYCVLNLHEQLRICNELLLFPRASNKAEVICTC